jgi:Xaa-Pro aminopeptidase/Xaa-Pro dipeptidase
MVERIRLAQELLDEYRVSALLLMSSANVFYLSGLKASLAYLVITKEKAYLLTDGRYFERAKPLAHDLLEVHLILENPLQTLKKFLRSLGVSSVGIEGDYVTIAVKSALRSRFYKLIPLLSPLKKLRLKKDKTERELIKKAINLTDRIFKELLDEPLSGETELSLRGKIVNKAFTLGSTGESFPAIVAFREHSAIPHWESSSTKINGKGALLFDMGVVYQGYVSDFTRTVYLGRADEEFKRAYQWVKEAYFKALEMVKVGRDVREVDLAVRDYFKEKGVLSHFTHSTGHGVGIEVHEPPRLYYKLKEKIKIEEGMVFTIEPGLYFPGKFGIRLENIVFVEDGRGVVYSEVPLELLEL